MVKSIKVIQSHLQSDTTSQKVLENLHSITIFYQNLWSKDNGIALSRQRKQLGIIAMYEFRRLLEHEIPRLRRYARALTRDSNRADDLVQDTIVRALAKAHLWQPGTDLRAWLFTIMHNQYVNDLRRAARQQVPIDVDLVASTLPATTDPSASRQLSELDHALGRLSKGQREVVLLVGLEGMSYDEAAKVIGVPIGTIRSRLGRAREALRSLMGIDEEAKSVDRVVRSRRTVDRHIATA
jgi:RNA polymerase sigma-70 factor (ECF subfamily)